MIYPMLTMMLIPIILIPFMLSARIKAVRTGALKLNEVNSKDASRVPPQVLKFSNHFSNLFEMPVLFYALCLLVLQLGIDSNLLRMIGFGYVGFRLIHTFISITYNYPPHRAAAFMLSNIMIVIIWIQVFLHIINRQ